MKRAIITAAPAAALAVSLYAVELPLYIEAPGPARDVIPLIEIDDARTYQPQGRLLLTTVNVGRVNAYDALAAWIDPAVALVPERAVLPPGQTEEEYERVSRSQMDQSKIAGIAAALGVVEDYPREHGPGVVVQDSIPGSPADGKLFPGDLITEVDGRPLSGLRELTRLVRRAGTERTLRLTVQPVEGGAERTVRLRPARLPDQDAPLIGIFSVANFPFPVQIESGAIGGPSAGLMWALGVADLLTSGDLTGGRSVAGTGVIASDGQVGAIGGIRLKVLAAERAGAETFLAPEGNVAEARRAADRIAVVPVSELEDAIRYLEGSR